MHSRIEEEEGEEEGCLQEAQEEELVFFRVSPRKRISALDDVLSLKQKYVDELVAKKTSLDKTKKITDFFKVKKKRASRCRIETKATLALREAKST